MDYEVNNNGGDGNDVSGHVFLVLVASHRLIVCRNDTLQHQNYKFWTALDSAMIPLVAPDVVTA